jgi:hypothetical protein
VICRRERPWCSLLPAMQASSSHRRVSAGPGAASTTSRRACVRVHAAATKPVVMVNSCTGKMGQAVANAALRAGLTLAPYTLCSDKEAAEKGTVEVAGQQLQLVGPSTRDEVIAQVCWCGWGGTDGGRCCRRCCQPDGAACMHACASEVTTTHAPAALVCS